MKPLSALPPPAGDIIYLQVKQELERLENARFVATFAARLTLYALPVMVTENDAEVCWWYLQGAEQYLLAIFRASQAAWLAVAEPNEKNFNAANHAARAASLASSYASRSETASLAAKTVAEATRATTDPNFAPYAAVYAVNAGNLRDIIANELRLIKAGHEVVTMLIQPFTFNEELTEKKQILLDNLEHEPKLDYWVRWLKDRYTGKPINLEKLRNSVFLPAHLHSDALGDINTRLKSIQQSD